MTTKDWVDRCREYKRRTDPDRMQMPDVIAALADEVDSLRRVADAAAAFVTDGSMHRELVAALAESGR